MIQYPHSIFRGSGIFRIRKLLRPARLDRKALEFLLWLLVDSSILVGQSEVVMILTLYSVSWKSDLF